MVFFNVRLESHYVLMATLVIFNYLRGEIIFQSEVVSGALADVLHAVLAGNDGCVLSFGGSSIGKSYTMLGSHGSIGEFGVIPSAVGWIYKTIKEQKSKTGARFSVRVSAVAVDSTGTLLSDLLAEYAQGQGR